MMRGAFQGMIDEIDTEVERFCAINKDLIVIIHGGDAPSFVNHLKKGIFANENWTALGLWAMSRN
jgi:type III pantothenate kinase